MELGKAASMACSICGAIETSLRAETGCGESWCEPITRLEGYDLDRREDFRECPECHSVFHFSDDTAWTGSGSNDSETLIRLSPALSDAIRAVRAGGDLSDAELAAIAIQLAELPAEIRDTTAALLRARLDLRRKLVPQLLDRAAAQPRAVELVKVLTSTPDDAARVQTELARRPAVGALASLREHVRVLGCSICRDIKFAPPVKTEHGELPPKLAGLKRLAHSPLHDVLECPECGSLFEWDRHEDALIGPGVLRISVALAKAISEIFHAPEGASSDAIQTIEKGGPHWAWIRVLAEQRGKN